MQLSLFSYSLSWSILFLLLLFWLLSSRWRVCTFKLKDTSLLTYLCSIHSFSSSWSLVFQSWRSEIFSTWKCWFDWDFCVIVVYMCSQYIPFKMKESFTLKLTVWDFWLTFVLKMSSLLKLKILVFSTSFCIFLFSCPIRLMVWVIA